MAINQRRWLRLVFFRADPAESCQPQPQAFEVLRAESLNFWFFVAGSAGAGSTSKFWMADK
jgi:hypothetical protein